MPDDRRAALPDVERIAVLHARGLGDLIFALPALAALRACYPQAELTVLGSSWYPELLAGRPVPVDRVVPVPAGAGLDGVRRDDPQVEAFEREQRDRCYDLGVQLQGGGRHSNPFLLRLAARHNIGSRAPDAPALDRTIPYFHYQSEVLRALEVVGLAGAAPVELTPRFEVAHTDRQASLRACGESPEALVVIHAGAGHPRRRWPAERFAAVADALTAAGAHVVLIGTERDREPVSDVVAHVRRPVTELLGRLSMPALAGLLHRAALVLSNDSGPLHLAAAVGTPTVGLFWCGNLINAGPFTRCRHRPVISWQLDCAVCGQDCTRVDCGHNSSFLLPIEPSQVVAPALDLLGGRGRGASVA